jgi:hypothetical protein
MTLFDQQTELLPPPPQAGDSAPAPAGRGVLLVVLAGVLLVLLATAAVIAETLSRAEVERTVADTLRSELAIPDSERVQVDIEGSILLQQVLGRFDRGEVTVYSHPLGRSNTDITLTMEGLRQVDGDWTADRLSGAITLSAAQATALFLPAELQGRMRIGFVGTDITVGASVLGGTSPNAVDVALTPHFENGWLSARLSSVTVNGKTLSVDELAAQTGIDPASAVPAPVCLAESVPSSLHLRDVHVVDQRLRLELDLDLTESAARRDPGVCV